MAALNFPTSPSVNDEYTANGSTWKWDGSAWNLVATKRLTNFIVSETATGKTISSWDYIIVTTATQTITLPASPANGDMVGLSVGDFTDTVVGRNGNTISGIAEDLTVDVANVGLFFIYSSSTSDWRIL